MAEPLDGEDHPSSEGPRYCDGPSRFNLLPVAGGESERNHVLLAVAALFAKLADSLAQGAEEFTLIHTPVCSLLRADSLRAE